MSTLFHRRRRSSASLSGSSSSSSSFRSRSPPKKPPKRTSSPPRKTRRLSPSASHPRRRHRPSPPATPPPKTRHSPTPQQSNRTRKSRVSVSPGRTSGKGKNHIKTVCSSCCPYSLQSMKYLGNICVMFFVNLLFLSPFLSCFKLLGVCWNGVYM